ncbi:DUF1642 domain-containing protein [uncultured Lacticaseibacillus sp.]|uniref:DUF1642 domain-containing protein n=1 Tax=uncultured Lacticaseibacillus sp. TaxID=2775882 RepID=UPI00258D6A59|nr:DUF1642 domain-containing protein [uncultured Lacticaseibacillus sp.]
MSEEKLYAVKNDEGKYWDFEDRDDFWELTYASCPTTDNELDAKDVIHDHGGHIVTFVEETKPLVVPEWFDKWLDAFCRQGDGYSWRGLAVGRILQQGWGKSINDSYKAFDSHWAIPHVENKQVDYVLNHKKELMVAALTGNYTVAKEKKYLVHKVLGGKQKHELFAQAYRSSIYPGTVSWILTTEVTNKPNGSFAQFTEAEIEHYDLQDCEKEEVTDDEQ